MVSLMTLLAGELAIPAGLGVWEDIIRWIYGFIGDYGCTVILIAVVLKLLMFPLDFFQRKSTAKTQAMQMKLKPQLEKLQQKYKNDKNTLNQKTMELYKKEGGGMFGSCGIMILYMAVSLFVFMTLFFGMNNIAKKVNVQQYAQLRDVYVQSIGAGDSVEEANQAVFEKYNETKTSWLWIENIWRPDRLVSPIATFDEYASTAKISKKDANYEQQKAEYEEIMNPLKEKLGNNNGYFILIILAAGVTFLSSWLSTFVMNKDKRKEDKKKKQLEKEQKANGEEIVVSEKKKDKNADQGRILSAKGEREKKDDASKKANPLAGKILMIVLPIIMVFITWGYNAAFALYIVAMSTCGAIINLILSIYFSKRQDKLIKPKGNNKNQVVIAKPDYVRQ